MPIVEASSEIAAAQADLFDLAQDYHLRLRWDPFLSAMEFRDGASEAAVGVHVWVRAKNHLTMEVVYLTLDRPRSVAMKMTRGPWFFERFAGTWRFEALSTERTRVTFRYGFETRFRLVRPWLNRVISFAFARDIAARLAALKSAAEDGLLLEALRRGREA